MKTTAIFLALFLAFGAQIFGQSVCLSAEEAQKIIESINASPPVKERIELRKELLAMRLERENLNDKIAADTQKNQTLIPQANALGEKQLARVCQILKENGWLTGESLKDDGFDALLFLAANNRNISAQRELLPIFIAASKKNLLAKSFIASLVDSIRVGAGLPQIFGTQAVIRNNIVYLHPILNEEKVDEWRKAYDLGDLRTQILSFERRYLLPVLKSMRLPSAVRENEEKTNDAAILGITEAEIEPLKVETKLVNLNVSVLTKDGKAATNLKLTKEDFVISEDGAEQEISFFSNVEQPFDLVLLLDFSSSTEDQRGLIKKSAQRFVEAARATDRIAVVAFASEIVTVSELTSDKAVLTRKIKDIKINGGSPIWDSLKFVYDKILKTKDVNRRSAVVVLTDGEDYSLENTFADAMEVVRRGNATVFPIYLGRDASGENWRERGIRKQQRSLELLADESGGQFYKAREVKDLNGIYEQVINRVGQIYSIGYEPKNEIRNGGWRALTVKIKTQPDLIARTRRGYYAN